MRRGVAILTIAIGAVLVMIPVAYSMFGRTADAERILDRFEFLTLADNPARYLDEAETTRAGSVELVDEAIPGLAAGAGLTGDELDRVAAERFPAFSEARAEVPEAHDFSVRYSEQLDAVDDKFASVYDIPVSGLPLTATPWLFVIGGLACLGAGLAALRTAGRAPLVVILALGIAMVLGPLALSAPSRSADGEDVKDFAGRGLTATAADAARRASTALNALVAETDTEILPYLARRQGIPAAQVESELAADFPAANELLAQWDVIGPRLARLSDAVAASVAEFESAKKLPISFPVWVLLGAGAALAASAGTAMARGDHPHRPPSA